jgi:hypothetical protein
MTNDQGLRSELTARVSDRSKLLLPLSLPLCSLCIMIALTGHHSREWLGELIEKSYLGSPD